jgi:hypothetical protein
LHFGLLDLALELDDLLLALEPSLVRRNGALVKRLVLPDSRPENLLERILEDTNPSPDSLLLLLKLLLDVGKRWHPDHDLVRIDKPDLDGLRDGGCPHKGESKKSQVAGNHSYWGRIV